MSTHFNSIVLIIWTLDLFQRHSVGQVTWVLPLHQLQRSGFVISNSTWNSLGGHSNFLVFPPIHFAYLKVVITPFASYYFSYPLQADLKELKIFFNPSVYFPEVFGKIIFSWNANFFTVPIVHFLLQRLFS